MPTFGKPTMPIDKLIYDYCNITGVANVGDTGKRAARYKPCIVITD